MMNNVLDGAAVSPSLKKMRKLVSAYGLVSSVTWLPVTEAEADFAISPDRWEILARPLR